MWLSPSGQVAHATLDWRLRRTGIFNGIKDPDLAFTENIFNCMGIQCADADDFSENKRLPCVHRTEDQREQP